MAKPGTFGAPGGGSGSVSVWADSDRPVCIDLAVGGDGFRDRFDAGGAGFSAGGVAGPPSATSEGGIVRLGSGIVGLGPMVALPSCKSPA